MTISELFYAYTRDVVRFGNLSEATARHVEGTRRKLVAYFGEIPVSELSFDKIVYLKQEVSKTCGISSTRGHIIRIRCVLKYARRHSIECLDYDCIAIPKKVTILPNCASVEDVQRLLDAASTAQIYINRYRDRAIIALLYSSGLRVSELCSLNVEHMNGGRTFTIVGKNSRPRICFIDDRARLYVDEYLSLRRNGYKTYYRGRDNLPTDRVRREYPPDLSSPLFLSSFMNKRIDKNEVSRTFRCLLERSGIQKRITPHSLRHGFATNLMGNHAPLHTVSRMMGHASVSTTAVYLHVVDTHLEEDYVKYHTI